MSSGTESDACALRRHNGIHAETKLINNSCKHQQASETRILSELNITIVSADTVNTSVEVW